MKPVVWIDHLGVQNRFYCSEWSQWWVQTIRECKETIDKYSDRFRYGEWSEWCELAIKQYYL